MTPIQRIVVPSLNGSARATTARSAPYGQFQTRDVIGTRTPRLDGPAKVTGRAVYTADVRLEGMLYAVIVRSPHAAAKVWNVDTSQAVKMPGVRGILTYAGKTVRFEGDEVAAVAADTLDQAKDAADAIQVEYEVYPAVVTTEDAMAPDAPQVYDTKANVSAPAIYEQGDIQSGFAQADVVIESDYTTQVQTHSPMEPHGAVAVWESASQLTVYISTQGVFSSASELADYFGLETANVRVLCEFIGGGFGSKVGAGTYGVIAAELAQMTGAPVKVVLDRRAEQLAAGNRPDSIQHIKVGARSDGTLTALELVGYATPGVGSGAGFSEPARSYYDIPNYRAEEYSVYTNCGTAMTMRAPGHPQGAFVLESALDQLAYALGIDPLELRLANNQYPIREEEFRVAAERFGWSQRNPQPGADSGPVKRGMGLASATWSNWKQRGIKVNLTINPDGQVIAETGASDIGTGTRTWVGMLIAEELGLEARQIEVRLGDSSMPYGPMAAGSGTTPSLAPVARHAGELGRQGLAEVVAPLLGTTADQLVFDAGMITAPSGESIPFAEGCSYLSSPLQVQGTRSDNPRPGPDIVVGVQMAEVEVDTRTGKVTVLRVTAVHNAGRVLNLLTAESQVIGGIIQGMNYALFEERVMDRNLGLMLNANLEAYKIGGAKDMPEIDAVVLDVSSGGTYVGAMGLGEVPTIPTSGAIANAVYHAIGARVYTLPITPARVLEALGTVSSSRSTRSRKRGGRR